MIRSCVSSIATNKMPFSDDLDFDLGVSIPLYTCSAISHIYSPRSVRYFQYYAGDEIDEDAMEGKGDGAPDTDDTRNAIEKNDPKQEIKLGPST